MVISGAAVGVFLLLAWVWPSLRKLFLILAAAYGAMWLSARGTLPLSPSLVQGQLVPGFLILMLMAHTGKKAKKKGKK